MYYIMNAKSLFDDKSATIGAMMGTWGDDGSKGTILVCRRERGYNTFSKIFVSGSGHGYEMAPKTVQYTQDTGNGYSNRNKQLIIENVIEYENGMIVNKLNDIGLNEKRGAWCMK